uniref:Uncharacterized protein n=1 Tax=Arundo donax TaxID=35708 RepID=A0A0A9CB08_ARUDO
MSMSFVWDVARSVADTGVNPEELWETSDEDQEGCYFDSLKEEQNTARWNRGKPGHFARKRSRRA